MRKIAYFCTQFNTVKSGPGRFANYLWENQSKKNSFVFFTDDYPISGETDKIIRIPQVKFLTKIPLYWIVRSFLFYTTFKNWTKKGNTVDAIICSSALEAIFLLSLKNTLPVYVMINDYKYMKSRQQFGEMFFSNRPRKTFSRFFLFYIERYIVKRAFLVITNSYHTKNIILQIYNVPEQNIFVLYKAIDPNLFKYKSRVFSDIHHFLFIKHDWRIGGLDIIIQAFSQLNWQKEISLTVVGIPLKDKKTILRMVKKHHFKGRVIMYPLLNSKSLLPLFYKNDLYISMSRQESFGVSIVEAMSTGLPVIASDAGAIPEILNAGDAGIMIEKNNVNNLILQLNIIKENPTLLKAQSEKARLQSLKFSTSVLEHNLDQLLSI